MKDVVFSLCMFFAVMFLPIWVIAFLFVVGIAYMRQYAAVIGFAFLYDALYFSGDHTLQAPLIKMVPLSVYALATTTLALAVRSRLREEV